jgi:hypothetical protein
MDVKKLSRPQLEGFYLVCHWITRTLEQPINVVSYMDKVQRIHIQFGQPGQRRAFYVKLDGTSSPNWNN